MFSVRHKRASDHLERPLGPLIRQEEGRNESDNERDITDHQYDSDNEPKNRCMYGEELQQFHEEDNLLIGFFNMN